MTDQKNQEVHRSKLNESRSGDKLITEAIKRILLDVIVRGHGDRLIGKWSKNPELNQFLRQVPYMLDRINQVHLACMRTETLQSDHLHHYHRHNDSSSSQSRPLGQSSLHDLVNLIGTDHHWLVRTRDPLGLTPLHKAVLFNNRPIVEYILDRYPDELAPMTPKAKLEGSRNDNRNHDNQPLKLIDAQDKYGRTALHYASSLIHGRNPCKTEIEQNSSYLYHFLLAKGATTTLQDFRAKTAAYYLRHPNQLRARSIIYLAHKLNANYQANVLSKCLRAPLDHQPLERGVDLENLTDDELDDQDSVHDRLGQNVPDLNRESMSVSCGDLQTLTKSSSSEDSKNGDQGHISLNYDIVHCEASDSISIESNELNQTHESVKLALKHLRADRSNKQVVSAKQRQKILKTLNEGDVDKINELLIEGYAEFLVNEAPISCWNQQSKRYINRVIPELMRKVDLLHEYIVSNNLDQVIDITEGEPMLARIKRPYRRVSMSSIHLAAKINSRVILKYLIRKFPEIVKQPDSQGATCLHWAARSLKNERLYCWILEKFGPQLEQVRDLRGRIAEDYRQQAIRYVSSVQLEYHSLPMTKQVNNPSAISIIQKTQRDANKLQFIGNKSNLHEKSGSLIQRKSARRPAEKHQNSVLEKPESNILNNDNIHIGIRSPSTEDTEFDNGHEVPDEHSQQEDQPLDEEFSPTTKKLLTFKWDELANSQRCDSIGSTTASSSPSKDNITTADNQNYLNEMVKIDINEVSEIKEYDQDTTENNQSVIFERPPSSASSAQRLDSMIMDKIKSADFKKLEHLVLAGCGQRILNLSASCSTIERQALDERVKDFIANRVPYLMDTIKEIHRVLHSECFAYPTTYCTEEQLNNKFHKLCNLLLNHKSLIMARDEFGASPLNIALMRCDKRLVDYLLRRHPGAASGPDHESRNALHYMAITLASCANIESNSSHETIKLTRIPNSLTENLSETEVLGYWVVSKSIAEEIYTSLFSRYEDLHHVKDRYGLTCSDYLNNKPVNHVDIRKLPVGFIPANAISICCPEYSKLLQRYNYQIINDNFDESDEQTGVQPSELHEGDDLTTKNIKSEHPSNIETIAAPRMTRNRSHDGFGVSQRVNGKSLSETNRRKTSDDLFDHLDGNLEGPRGREHPLRSASPRQIAPRPGVGCEQTYPLLSHTPIEEFQDDDTTDEQPSRMVATLTRHKSNLKINAQSRRQHQDDLLSNLDSGVTSNGLIPGIDQQGHHHKRRIQHSRNQADKPIIGGVIVPTIIHNDKMDEIETYDIIYRQVPSAGRSSGSSSRSTSTDEVAQAEDKKLIENRRSKGSGKMKKPLLDTTRKIDLSSSESEEDDDDDERVERLSNEFEDRVRKEKSELRAKVDQIMEEIKMSAKSGRSSRFLASPADLKGDLKNQNQDTSVMMATNLESNSDRKIEEKIARRSFSSSGHSSASRNSNSSYTNSQATSCSSASSSASSTVSTSSRSSVSTIAVSLNNDKTGNSNRMGDQTTNGDHVVSGHSNVARRVLGPLLGLSAENMSRTSGVSKNVYGQTYLHFIASRSQAASTLYKVLDHASHMIGERDIFYRTARDVAVQFNLSNNVQVFDKFIIDLFIGAKTGLLSHLSIQGYSPLIHVSDPDGNDIMLILKLLKLDQMIHFLLQMADFQRWRDELHTFIRHGYSAGVSELIKKHKDLVKAKSVHARTSLHLAVLFDRLEMINELLETDPTSVNCTDNMGRTALHYTYGLPLKSVEEIRDKLVACGANLDVRDVKMRTPKYYYIFKREIEEIKRIELELN